MVALVALSGVAQATTGPLPAGGKSWFYTLQLGELPRAGAAYRLAHRFRPDWTWSARLGGRADTGTPGWQRIMRLELGGQLLRTVGGARTALQVGIGARGGRQWAEGDAAVRTVSWIGRASAFLGARFVTRRSFVVLVHVGGGLCGERGRSVSSVDAVDVRRVGGCLLFDLGIGLAG